MAGPLDRFDPATQAAMSAVAIRVFANIMEAWSIKDQDAALLLGNVPLETYRALKENSDDAHLEDESLTRISLAVGICKALHAVFGRQLADRWIKLPNTGSIFQGVTPITYMLHHGVEGNCTGWRRSWFLLPLRGSYEAGTTIHFSDLDFVSTGATEQTLPSTLPQLVAVLPALMHAGK